MSPMKSFVFILFLFVFFCFQAKAQFTQLVWSDEFDGTSVNKSNWVFETGNNNGWGNNELEYYTSRPDNATVRDGNLMIIAKKENYGGKSYTSARMKTQGLHDFTYGKIEARIKAPVGQGIWPAFWMLGKSVNQSGVGWPKCGEIDILEHINSVSVVNGTIHWDNNGHASYGKTTTCDVTKYHVYGIEWDTKAIKWFVDGKSYGEASIANNINSTNEFHAPFFILLNLAVGGVWPGNPTATTAFPDTLFVDYVRVYGLTTGTSSIEGENTKQGVSQNFPNPFYPKTTISFNVPTKSFVSLKVFNANGMEVSTLASGELTAGNHERQWDASGLPSGIYYYRLQAGDLMETKKLLVQR
ncbi:MAG TPA: family 16 glycosylhydrolase [Prolixibacteraceae bacterium]|nr:family 16 glycosylhydrolase [Prolixibacteraceae bacterium]